MSNAIPKEYPAGRRWGKSLARRRWEAEQREAKTAPDPAERIRRWDNAMQRIFKGIIPRAERHRQIREAATRGSTAQGDGAPPAWLAPKTDPSNPKGGRTPIRRKRRATVLPS